MKLIHRWPLMRNVRTENVSEHSLQVAMVAHALAIIKNRRFGGQVNAERIAMLAMYHDASEVITEIYQLRLNIIISKLLMNIKIEKFAQQKLLEMLPEELQDDFRELIIEDSQTDEEHSLVKQADSLCAYLKCLEELSAGNSEFKLAKRLEKILEERKSPEMDYFMEKFVPGFKLSLDEISN
ncbi:5'-deoxynucleotidase [Providencia rettgeri]|uniref:5'-deoxynucleotidase n=1 Tax=Providencia rettgeri TaxID=587 RepID=A0A939SQN3_PRORE|nr:5'-deoxynucleotidase [Providencia rettgeri]